MGAPWVFDKIKTQCAGGEYMAPSVPEIGRIILRHHDLLADLLGAERAIRHCRKLGSFYSKSFAGAREFRNRLNFCFTREDLAEQIARYFV